MMDAEGSPGIRGHPANERLKRNWPAAFRLSVIAATLLHVLMVTLWPSVKILQSGPDVLRVSAWAPRVLTLTMPIPAPPQSIGVPSVPSAWELLNDDEPSFITSLIGIEAFDPSELAEPTLAPGEELAPFHAFVPSVVAPQLLNRAEVARRVSWEYQWYLDRAYRAGDAIVRIWLDATGRVEKHEVMRSSGDRALDRIARNAVGLMKFSPAVTLGQPTSIVVTIPVSFRRTASGLM